MMAGDPRLVSASGQGSSVMSSPTFICNSKELGTNLLAVIKQELYSCDSFDFCVAFVTEGGLQPLIEALSDLRRRGVRGRLLTSTYLNFNSPIVFRKLLEFDNIETRVYQGNLHAKGYVFDENGTNVVIIGSSNLTQMALTCNREWNVLFHSRGEQEALQNIKGEFSSLWDDALTSALSDAWINAYEEGRPADNPRTQRHPTFCISRRVDAEYDSSLSGLTPNRMQKQALEALSVLHDREEPRALLISATGTGKTYLSAFDVQRVKPRRVLFLVHRRRILSASMSSYKRLLGDTYSYTIYEADCLGAETCVFAMCSTIVKHLDEFDPKSFDYIVIDEAHRTGSETYKRITSYFEPKFYLGMTATPNRTNGDFDVYALFNHVIAFQITLQDALANDMLAPFHYFGIADLSIDEEELDDLSLFNTLTSEQRVDHIVGKIEEYTIDKKGRRGLVFCSRNDEARALSECFNNRGYRTLAVSGENSDAERDAAIERLENGELEYLFSVDIFNEGIDIPSVNQIIMLRKTESAIVFVQQLGRGLRKFEDKEYTLVLDFIGNYQKNFFVPVALSGDNTYNKDKLRSVVKEGSTVVPGCSTISFDRISEARIYKAIDGGKFTATKFLKEEYAGLRYMLGRIPGLEEFDRNGSIDPLLIFKKFGSYHAFLKQYEKDYTTTFSKEQESVLRFLSQKLGSGKRAYELTYLRGLILERPLLESYYPGDQDVDASSRRVLSGRFSNQKGFIPLVDEADGSLSDEFTAMLSDGDFRGQVLELIAFALSRNASGYSDLYQDTSLVLNAKYTYEEVCWLLNWQANINGQNIGGYKFDADTNTYPVFINYEKDPGISDSIRYEDRFISNEELVAISKQPRNLESPEILRLKSWPGNGMKSYLFVRKNKDDGESKEFYFLGEIMPTGTFNPIVMPGANKPAVEITYRLKDPVRPDLYSYLTSSIEEDEARLIS